MEQTIRIYRRKVDFISEPEQPLIQIPINAIADVVTNINPYYLQFNSSDQKKDHFLKQAFAIRLKKDFNYVYVDNYNHNGLDEEWLGIAKQGNLVLDSNTKALVEFFEFFERKTLGTLQEEQERSIDKQINEQKIEHFLQTARPEAEKLRQHLRTKLLIFNQPDDKVEYI